MFVGTGYMCLIGPRPEMVTIERWALAVVPDFAERLVLRPGLTGWAQITQGYAPQEDAAWNTSALSVSPPISRSSVAGRMAQPSRLMQGRPLAAVWKAGSM